VKRFAILMTSLKTKIRTLFLVVEVPGDQDFGLEDHVTAAFQS